MQPIECDVLEAAPTSAFYDLMTDRLSQRTAYVIQMSATRSVVYDLTDPRVALPRFRSLVPWVPSAGPAVEAHPPPSLWRISWGGKNDGVAP